MEAEKLELLERKEAEKLELLKRKEAEMRELMTALLERKETEKIQLVLKQEKLLAELEQRTALYLQARNQLNLRGAIEFIRAQVHFVILILSSIDN